MAEAPEIPEANDPFEKRAAVTIAILAVVLAVVGNKGDNAKTDAIIKTNEATNQWSYFQAKGIKGSIASAEQELLTLLAPSQGAPADITVLDLERAWTVEPGKFRSRARNTPFSGFTGLGAPVMTIVGGMVVPA